MAVDDRQGSIVRIPFQKSLIHAFEKLKGEQF